MPKKTYKILRFDAGLNDDSDPKDISDNEVSESQNANTFSLGRLTVLGDITSTQYKTIAGSISGSSRGSGFFAFSADQDGFLDGTDGYPGNTYYIVEKAAGVIGIGADDETGSITVSNADDLSEASMYYIDGALRICEGSHEVSAPSSKWKGWINAKTLLPTATQSDVAITDGWYEQEPAGIIGAFPTFTYDNQVFCKNAIMLTKKSASVETWYSFSKASSTTTTDADYDGDTSTATSLDAWGLALEFYKHPDGNGTGTWMPKTSTRYRFYVTTMYDGHTQESSPQLLRMFDGGVGGGSLSGHTVDKEIAFRKPASADAAENIAVNFRPVCKIIGNTSAYNFGADDGSNSGNTLDLNGNKRISGFRIYWASNEDGYAALWQMFDANFEEGVKPIGIDGGTGATGAYASWVDPTSLNIDTWNANVYSNGHATMEMSTDTYFSNPPRYLQYDVLNGHPATDTIAVESFKTSCIANRRVYIGNVCQDGWIHGDRMLKSPVNQFDKFPTINNIDVVIEDGDEIVLLLEYADRILQFKKNALYIINVSGNSEFLESEHRFKGISNPGAACRTDYGVAWVNQHGCYYYDGQRVIDVLEDTKVHRINSATWTTFIGTSGNERMGFNPSKRQFIVKGDSSNSYIYDLISKSWTKGIGNMIGTNANFLNDPVDGSLLIYGGGYIYKWIDTPTANKSFFDLRTRFIDFGEPSQRKKIYKLYITHKYAGAGDKLGLYGEIFSHSATGGQGAGELSNDFFIGYLEQDSEQAGNWITQVLEMPSTDLDGAAIKFNNVQAIRLYILSEMGWGGGEAGATFDGEAPYNFECNDITIIYRAKSIK